MMLCHEGADYAGFIHNEAYAEYEQILLAAYDRTSPLRAGYRPTENSTVQEDLENIAEFIDDDFDYVERHHPLPTSLGGTEKLGFVTIELTFEEHFRAHQLLIAFTEGEDRRSMLYALSQMRRGKARQKILTPEQYAIARQAHKEAVKGRTYSGEVRANMSAGRLALFADPVRGPIARANASVARRGHGLTDEHCRNISKGGRERYNGVNGHTARALSGQKSKEYWERNPDRRVAEAKRMAERNRSPESREKTSARQRGKKLPAETCVKMSTWQIGRKLSEETKAKIGRAGKGRRPSEKSIARLIAWNRSRRGKPQKPLTPEARLAGVFGHRLGPGSMRRVMSVAECEAA